MKAADEFKDKTTAPNQLWQTDFTYLKVIGWGWFYLSTVRRQIKRVRTGLCGREALAHLWSDVRRRFGGSSSVGSRWCVV
jgi:transposase InsO family protein